MEEPPGRSSGRPRSLTLERVLEEATKMGVDNLEMAPLAKRLGVAVGTLYSYVNGRDHLIFQIASRTSEAALVKDRGQDWQTILTDHAEMTFGYLREWPQLIINLVSGNAGTSFGARIRRHVVALLMDRGFARKTAEGLFYQTNQLVFGAVVATQFVHNTIQPMLREDQSLDSVGIPADFGRFEPALRQLIASVEADLKSD